MWIYNPFGRYMHKQVISMESNKKETMPNMFTLTVCLRLPPVLVWNGKSQSGNLMLKWLEPWLEVSIKVLTLTITNPEATQLSTRISIGSWRKMCSWMHRYKICLTAVTSVRHSQPLTAIRIQSVPKPQTHWNYRWRQGVRLDWAWLQTSKTVNLNSYRHLMKEEMAILHCHTSQLGIFSHENHHQYFVFT